MSRPVLFVAAEPRECAPWVARWEGVRDAGLPVHWSRAGSWKGSPVIAIANGAGGERARLAVLASPLPSAVCSIGFCGALEESLAIGDVFVADAVVTQNSRRTIAVCTESSATGPLFSAASIAQTAVAKRILRKSGAAAVEMEAAGALDAADELGVPFYCIRAVSDLAAEDFANDFNRFLMPDGRLNIAGLVANAFLNPLKRFGELFRLSRRTALASHNLGEFLARCSF